MPRQSWFPNFKLNIYYKTFICITLILILTYLLPIIGKIMSIKEQTYLPFIIFYLGIIVMWALLPTRTSILDGYDIDNALKPGIKK